MGKKKPKAKRKKRARPRPRKTTKVAAKAKPRKGKGSGQVAKGAEKKPKRERRMSPATEKKLLEELYPNARIEPKKAPTPEHWIPARENEVIAEITHALWHEVSTSTWKPRAQTLIEASAQAALTATHPGWQKSSGHAWPWHYRVSRESVLGLLFDACGGQKRCHFLMQENRPVALARGRVPTHGFEARLLRFLLDLSAEEVDALVLGDVIDETPPWAVWQPDEGKGAAPDAEAAAGAKTTPRGEPDEGGDWRAPPGIYAGRPDELREACTAWLERKQAELSAGSEAPAAGLAPLSSAAVGWPQVLLDGEGRVLPCAMIPLSGRLQDYALFHQVRVVTEAGRGASGRVGRPKPRRYGDHHEEHRPEELRGCNQMRLTKGKLTVAFSFSEYWKAGKIAAELTRRNIPFTHGSRQRWVLRKRDVPS